MSSAAFHLANANASIGAVELCAFFSCIWLGVILTQALSYFDRFPHDPVPFKLLVGACLTACLADTALDISWTYKWTITYFGDPTIMAKAPFELGAIDLLSSALFVLVQGFFSWRLFLISQRKWMWPATVMLLTLMQFGCILYIASVALKPEDFSYLNVAFFPAGYVWLGASAVADLIVTCGMFYYLHVKARSVKASQSLFREILYRTVQSNVLVLISQFPGLVLFKLQRVGFWFLITVFTQPKILSFSLIGSLNSRKSTGSSLDVRERSAKTASKTSDVTIGLTRLPTTLGRRNSAYEGAPSLTNHRVSVHVDRETRIDIEGQDEGWKPPTRQMRTIKVVLPEEDEERRTSLTNTNE